MQTNRKRNISSINKKHHLFKKKVFLCTSFNVIIQLTLTEKWSILNPVNGKIIADILFSHNIDDDVTENSLSSFWSTQYFQGNAIFQIH